MGEHTPGPWAAEAITRLSMPNERPWVGRLAEGRYAALSCGETQQEAIANARLIAAAPDLLAALEIARGVMECSRHAVKVAGIDDAITLARAAIALALATQTPIERN